VVDIVPVTLVDDVELVPVIEVSVIDVSVIDVSVDIVPVVIDVSVDIVADVSPVAAVSVMLMFSSFLHPKANKARANTIKSARLFFIFSSLEFFVVVRERWSHSSGCRSSPPCQFDGRT
jgi:hypothetical protein